MTERGGATAGFFYAIAAIILCFGLLAVACGTCTNHDSLGPVASRYHHDDDGDDCQSGGCGNDQRRCSDAGDNCRGSFSPGPFDRSPVEISGNTICVMPGSCPAPPSDKKKGST
jgi:hypothetical protein